MTDQQTLVFADKEKLREELDLADPFKLGQTARKADPQLQEQAEDVVARQL